MSAGEMSDGSPVTPELDARMLAELREWRRRYPIASMHGITGDELDMLLRAVDERDALKAAACEMPDEGAAQWADPPVVRFSDGPKRDAANCRPTIPFSAEIPAEIRERAEPTPAYQWRAAGCVWGGDRMGAEAAMRHYARMHGGRLERRVAAGPWTATS